MQPIMAFRERSENPFEICSESQWPQCVGTAQQYRQQSLTWQQKVIDDGYEAHIHSRSSVKRQELLGLTMHNTFYNLPNKDKLSQRRIEIGKICESQTFLRCANQQKSLDISEALYNSAQNQGTYRTGSLEWNITSLWKVNWETPYWYAEGPRMLMQTVSNVPT